MKPVIGEGGRVTVPEDVIHSMKRNKVGLKGEMGVVRWVWSNHNRSTGDTNW